MELLFNTVIAVDCPLLSEPDVVAWLLSGVAPLCYPDQAAEDPHLRAVILAYDTGEGPHCPCHEPPDPKDPPQRLWDFVCAVAKEAGFADSFCYVRLNPTED